MAVEAAEEPRDFGVMSVTSVMHLCKLLETPAFTPASFERICVTPHQLLACKAVLRVVHLASAENNCHRRHLRHLAPIFGWKNAAP